MRGVRRALRYARAMLVIAIVVYLAALICTALGIGSTSLLFLIGLCAIGVIALAAMIWLIIEFSF